MPNDPGVARAVASALAQAGYGVVEPIDEVSNPFRLEIISPEARAFMVHIRVITRQAGLTSTHHRPAGEWHAQMIFDRDVRPPRGARGVTFSLRREANADPLVMGYVDWPTAPPSERLYVAFDPSHHDPYSYSKSLQVRAELLDEALTRGLQPFRRSNGEIIVAMRPEALAVYISRPEIWHDLTRHDLELLNDDVERALASELPVLSASEGPRERRVTTYARLVRLRAFSVLLKKVYERCAICGLACGPILEAAHIIPVTDPASTDTFDNGLGLCPLCHSLFDAGLVLIDGAARIRLNRPRIDQFARQGQRLDGVVLAGRLRASLYEPPNPSHRPSRAKLAATYAARNRA